MQKLEKSQLALACENSKKDNSSTRIHKCTDIGPDGGTHFEWAQIQIK